MHETVPVAQVQRSLLSILQQGELLLAALAVELAGLQVLAAQHRVDGTEPRSLEGHRNRHAQQLIRHGLDEVLIR